jgi:hypothetical protein
LNFPPPKINQLNEVVISGTLKPVERLENPVPRNNNILLKQNQLQIRCVTNVMACVRKTIAMFVTLATSESMV